MQFSVLRSYAATRFRDSTNQVVSDNDWKNYINSVYGNVLITMPYAPWNQASSDLTINAGSRSVALPTDVFRVTSVWDKTDQYPMVPLEGRNQVYNEYPQQIEIGGPQHYRIFNNLLEVYPLPAVNTIFTVEYLVEAADLVNDADVPVFPQQFHDMLVAGAVGMAYRDDGNLQQASSYDNEMMEMLKALQQEAGQPQNDRYAEIVDTNW